MGDKDKTNLFLFPVSGHENAAEGSIIDDVIMQIVAKPRRMVWTGADMSRQGNFLSGMSNGKTYMWTRNTWEETVGMALEKENCSSFKNNSKDKNDKKFESTAFLPDGSAFVEISECA